MQRKPFRREGEDVRRAELVSATLSSIASLGMEHTTVREIAIKAGVTPGLIRHYFSSKDELVLAAYEHYIEMLSDHSRHAVSSAAADPAARLAAFVTANLSAPIVDQNNLALWAGFIDGIRFSGQMAQVHQSGYMAYRRDAEQLIDEAYVAAGRTITPSELRRLGIALNAILDGLWLEGSLSPEEFGEGELSRIGMEAASALLGLNLQTYGQV
jgi:AcrR family transcriptional regulator